MEQISEQPVILVADDAPEFREDIIPKALGRLNAKVLKAKNLVETCLTAIKHEPLSTDRLELVVLDMHMPLREGKPAIVGSAGIRFLRSWRNLPDFDPTACPVVVFTAYPSYRNCVQAARAGAVAYLPKSPHETDDGEEGGIDDLVQTCRRLLDQPVTHKAPPPVMREWFDENFEWLNKEFGGRCVALVPKSQVTPSVALDGVSHAGMVIADCQSEEVLAQLLEFQEDIPLILRLPKSEEL